MATMIKQMAMALGYLHAKGILHLDIKPDNILVDHPPDNMSRTTNFYLGDFGLARARAEVTGREAGTPFFMAPELYLKLNPPCEKSDIWSFAMTIGAALGFWCPDEATEDAEKWASKLKLLGSKVPYTEGTELKGRPGLCYRRISAAAASGVLPPMFQQMLLAREQRPTATKCMHTHPNLFIVRPENPEPLRGWEGAKAPWLARAPLPLIDDSFKRTPEYSATQHQHGLNHSRVVSPRQPLATQPQRRPTMPHEAQKAHHDQQAANQRPEPAALPTQTRHHAGHHGSGQPQRASKKVPWRPEGYSSLKAKSDSSTELSTCLDMAPSPSPRGTHQQQVSPRPLLAARSSGSEGQQPQHQSGKTSRLLQTSQKEQHQQQQQKE
jgi:serine/threonine protein kinase